MRKLYLLINDKIGEIQPEIYGHFAEHIGGVVYGGIWVGKESEIDNINGFRRSVVEGLRRIKAPVIRWPGGCFAETYNWRDGIGEKRPVRRSWWTCYDGKYESNEVGSHEFADFCELVGAKPYFAANMTTNTPRDIYEWMDYCMSGEETTALAKERKANGRTEPFAIPFWGIGNENWCSGGNMTPETYVTGLRRYSTVIDNLAFDTKMFACGPNATDYEWTRRFCDAYRDSIKCINGFSMHYYCGQDGRIGECADFTVDEWYELLKQAAEMDTIINRNWNIIKGYGLENCMKLVVDEWGCWHKPNSGPSKGRNLYEQQSTMRDAMVTALTLNIFNNNCDKVIMANVAQLVNNLHCLFLADGDRCITTPTYHVFDLFKEHQGGAAFRTVYEKERIKYCVGDEESFTEDLSVSASVKDGYVTVTLANLSADKAVEVCLQPIGAELEETFELAEIGGCGLNAHNTFDEPDNVTAVFGKKGRGNQITLDKASITSLRFKVKEC